MEEVKTMEKASDEAMDAVQYIVVKIGNEQYGINIQYIDNIVRNQRITRVPKAQSYYKGVINIRGEIIPVMSIRLKLGLEDDNYTDKTRIIIIKVDGATIGVIVAVIGIIFLGIKYMTGAAEEQAKVKETLIPFVIGCIVVFGAFAIWSAVVNIIQNAT